MKQVMRSLELLFDPGINQHSEIQTLVKSDSRCFKLEVSTSPHCIYALKLECSHQNLAFLRY
jgi:hypothetical protein